MLFVIPNCDSWVVFFLYCKFGNFRDNFIFANSVKTHICDVENSRQGRDLPISVNDRVISPIREDFIFTKLRIFSKISEFTVSRLILIKPSLYYSMVFAFQLFH